MPAERARNLLAVVRFSVQEERRTAGERAPIVLVPKRNSGDMQGAKPKTDPQQRGRRDFFPFPSGESESSWLGAKYVDRQAKWPRAERPFSLR